MLKQHNESFNKLNMILSPYSFHHVNHKPHGELGEIERSEEVISYDDKKMIVKINLRSLISTHSTNFTGSP